MEPLSPQDPLHKVLGQARRVEVRPNFTQNVMRAIRQEPQRLTLRERLQSWLGDWTFQKQALAGVLTALIITVVVLQGPPPSVNSNIVATQKSEITPSLTASPALNTENWVTELDATDHLSNLLASQDASSLSDSDVALLLY